MPTSKFCCGWVSNCGQVMTIIITVSCKQLKNMIGFQRLVKNLGSPTDLRLMIYAKYQDQVVCLLIIQF